MIVVRNEVLVRQAGGRAGYRNRRPDGTHPNESQGRRSCEVLRHTVLHDGFQIGHVVVPTSRGRRGLCKAANSFRAIQKFMKSRPAGGDYGNRSDYTRAKQEQTHPGSSTGFRCGVGSLQGPSWRASSRSAALICPATFLPTSRLQAREFRKSGMPVNEGLFAGDEELWSRGHRVLLAVNSLSLAEPR